MAEEIFKTQQDLINIGGILMNMTDEQIQQFRELSLPLIIFLRENFHPHAKIILDDMSAELVEGISSFSIGG
jgi:hypothetical protein